jgi:Cft2 family RNA processing exonuclease
MDIGVNGRAVRLMIECGTEFIKEEGEGEIQKFGPGPDFSKIDDKLVDYVFITHAHSDHCGALGVLRKSGLLSESAKIISSSTTSALLELVLADSEKQGMHTILDTNSLLGRRKVVRYPGECEIFPGFNVFFAQSGHVPGAASIVIPTRSGKKCLFTGDMCKSRRPSVDGWKLPSKTWPEKWRTVDILGGTDLTYTEKTALRDEVKLFRKQVRSDLLDGKKVVIGVFTVGRSQDVPEWIRDIAIELGIEIWVDGAGVIAREMIRKNPWSDNEPFLPEMGDDSVDRIRDSKHREVLIQSQKPAVFVTTAGMGNYGPIVNYMVHGLPRRDFAFYFTSWVAPGSNADRLISKSRILLKTPKTPGDPVPAYVPSVRLWNSYKKEWFRTQLCADIRHFRLGAHGDLDEFIEFVQDIVKVCRKGKPLELMLLTHGNYASLVRAADALRSYAGEVILGMPGTIIEI